MPRRTLRVVETLKRPYRFLRYGVLRKITSEVVGPLKVAQAFARHPEWSADMARFRGLHAGERCFIIGNGPSLSGADLDLLKGEVTFSSNFAGRIFPQTSWRPFYHGVMDPGVLDRGMREVIEYEARELFVFCYPGNLEASKKVSSLDSVHMIRMTHGAPKGRLPKFSDDAGRLVYGGYTITYSLIQLAVHMGFSEIYLVGMDHSYARQEVFHNRGFFGKKVIAENHVEADHFYSESGGPGASNVDGMTLAYTAAQRFGASRGLVLANATRGGKLEVFPRVDLDMVLRSVPQSRMSGS